MREITVLYVDPDATAGTSPLRELVADPAIEVSRETSIADARAVLESTAVDCVVTEYDLPDGTGVELVATLRAVAPDTGVILVTDESPARIAEASPDGPVAEFVPRDVPEVGTRVVQLVKHTGATRSQTSYPLPPDEQARLAALATIDLDDERLGRALQRVTELATEHFAVPRSSVNIITERTQEFLASAGGEFEPTPRGDSACTYTILDGGVSVIKDIAVDPRFPDATDDAAVRFYAGATLTTREGHPVGTLCVYDDEPRVFGEADRAYLSLLAAEVMDWLEVAREPPTEPERAVGGGGADVTASGRGVRYGFPAPLFPDGVEPGTNILVNGPGDSGAREVALQLSQPEPYRNEGQLLLSADVSGRHLFDRAREVGDGVDPERVGVVDCSGIADEDHRFEYHDHIEGPGDVMAIEMAVATLYETLRSKGFDRVRIGLFSVSAMLAHADLRTVSRFVHMLTGRIIATGDLGVFYIDSSLDGDVSIDVIEHFCERTVEVRRRDDAVELRERGFHDGSSNWRPLDPQATHNPRRQS